MGLSIIPHPSPNFNDRPQGQAVENVVLHYTDMLGAQAALDRLCDKAAQVSAHYVIAEDGTIYRLVDEEKRAWHAGVSEWQGRADLNSRSIGIELDHPGHGNGYRGFDPRQIAALKALLAEIFARHNLPPEAVIAHSDIAPGRKIDPGELFPWADLAASGFGLWPDTAWADNAALSAQPGAAPDPAIVLDGLKKLGYTSPVIPWQPGNCDVLRAFQRHFDPESLGLGLTPRTATRLQSLLSSPAHGPR